jgi:hypothetical protein
MKRDMTIVARVIAVIVVVGLVVVAGANAAGKHHKRHIPASVIAGWENGRGVFVALGRRSGLESAPSVRPPAGGAGTYCLVLRRASPAGVMVVGASGGPGEVAWVPTASNCPSGTWEVHTWLNGQLSDQVSFSFVIAGPTRRVTP